MGCVFNSPIIGFITAIIFISQKNYITSIFDSSPQVLEFTSMYFSLIPLTYGTLGTVFLSIQSLNAVNKPLTGNFLSALRLVVIYLPSAYFLNISLGLNGIFLSRLFANIIVGVLATILVYRNFFTTFDTKQFLEQ